MSEIFKGFEDLLKLAQVLEEKAAKGELKTEVQFSSRPFSSIPRTGNIPRSPGSARSAGGSPSGSGFGVSRTTATPASSAAVEVPVESIGKTDLPEIGGLSESLRELKELVGIPLKRPELLQQLGLEPPKGVLLVGPPGTGKTLMARTLAAELGVNYITIVGPEIIGKYYGEAEGRLRGIFEQAARSAPCLIFIDEIDSLAPDRSQVEGEVEKRIVAQLLGLMDGFNSTAGVMVLAATNRPNHLDPALRRPGRFDREVVFRVPDRAGRLEILEILSRSMPLAEDVQLGTIADHCLGFVGADLKAICQKAAYRALRRNVPDLDAPSPADMVVTAADFEEAVAAIKPSVLRSVEVETPQITWEEIGGLTDIKQTLQEAVEGALRYPELYQQTKAQAPRGILLWGPPGTGKTLLAKAVAAQAQANFIAVNGPELLSRWVGASELAVRELFAKARQASPCVVFLDEIDTLAPARGGVTDGGVSDRLVGQLLTEMDGLRGTDQVLVIGATNRRPVLDPALLRSGRLDLQFKVDLPDESSRLAILKVHNSDRPLASVDLAHWAQRTEGWNGADLALFSNQAALQAIRRYQQDSHLSSAVELDPTQILIESQDFELAYVALEEQKNTPM
ncbi:MAG: AAA family ATPase [Prochlorotrichaceae cyanobacterium]